MYDRSHRSPDHAETEAQVVDEDHWVLIVSLNAHPTGHVNTVMRELNARPRKTLGYLTPAALFRAEVRSAPLQLR